MTEEFVTPAPQNWVVGIRTPAGFPKPLERVVVVQAHSETQARRAAITKVSVGKWKHVRPSTWQITTVQNADAPKEEVPNE